MAIPNYVWMILITSYALSDFWPNQTYLDDTYYQVISDFIWPNRTVYVLSVWHLQVDISDSMRSY